MRYSSQASREDLAKHSGDMMPLDAVEANAGGAAGQPAKAAAGVVSAPVPVHIGVGDELAPGVPSPVGAVVVSPVSAGMSTAAGMREELPVAEPQPE